MRGCLIEFFFLVFIGLGAPMPQNEDCVVSYTDCLHGEDLCLQVDFTDGGSEQIVLGSETDHHCIFDGFFLTEPERTVAATSPDCPMKPSSDLHVTFRHPKCKGMHNNIYKSSENREYPKRPAPKPMKSHFHKMAEGRQNITASNFTRQFPSTGFDLKMMVFYDRSFLREHKYDKYKAEETILKLLAHAKQAYLFQNSKDKCQYLKMPKVHFIVEDIASLSWTFPDMEGDYFDSYDLASHARNYHADVDLYLYFQYGGGGIADLAYYEVDGDGVCSKDRGKRKALNGWGGNQNDIQFDGATVAHEIGHTLNMHHDFEEHDYYPDDYCRREHRYFEHYNKRVSCTWMKSIMDYWCDAKEKVHTKDWSCCSIADFKELYDKQIQKYGAYCLDTHSNPCSNRWPGGDCNYIKSIGKCDYNYYYYWACRKTCKQCST